MDSHDLPPPPPTLKEAFSSQAQSQVESAARNRFWREVYRKVPDFLHPLIPGNKRTMRGDMEHRARRRVSAAIGGCLFSLFFFAAVGTVLVVVISIIGFAVVSG